MTNVAFKRMPMEGLKMAHEVRYKNTYMPAEVASETMVLDLMAAAMKLHAVPWHSG